MAGTVLVSSGKAAVLCLNTNLSLASHHPIMVQLKKHLRQLLCVLAGQGVEVCFRLPL